MEGTETGQQSAQVRLEEALAYERSGNLNAACKRYLDLIFSGDEQLQRRALNRLAQMTQESAEMQARVSWGVALASLGEWRRAEEVLAPLSDYPLALSNKIAQRWPELIKIRRKGLLPPWLSLLRLVDRVISLGFSEEALLLAHYGISHVSMSHERALVYFEAGRLGILHRQIALGVSSMRSALSFEPKLRRQARKLVDQALVTQRVEGDDLEDLFRLRIAHIEQVDLWVNELLEAAHPSQRFELANRFGTCAEFQADHPDAAFYFYSEGLYTPNLSESEQQVLIDGLSRVAQDHDDQYDQRLNEQLRELALWKPLALYLKRGAPFKKGPDKQAQALSESAQIFALQLGDFDEAIQLFDQAMRLDSSSVQLQASIRAARSQENWAGLDRLLSLRMGHTSSIAKKQALLRVQAQSRIARHLYTAAYLAYRGCLSLMDDEEIREDLRLLLELEAARTEIELWLTREDGLRTDDQWVEEFFRYQKDLTLAGFEIGDELIAHALSHHSDNWSIAESLLATLATRGMWTEWVQWVATSPKHRWPAEVTRAFVNEAIERSRLVAPHYTASLIKAFAEWLDVHSDSLKERAEAWNAYLDERPGDREALESFDPLARAEGQWGLLAQRYEQALPARQTGKIHLLELLAEIYDAHLNDPKKAESTWQQIIHLKADHERAGARLAMMFVERKSWTKLRAHCENWTPPLTQQGLYDEVLLRAAIGTQNLFEAFERWEQLTDERTQQLFITALLDLAERAGHGEIILKVTQADQALQITPESHIRRLKLLAQTESYLLPVVDHFAALRAWFAVWELAPEDPDVYVPVAELYSQMGKKADLIELRNTALEELDDQAELEHLLRICATSLEGRFREYAEAFQSWISIIERFPESQDEAFLALERIARKSGLWVHLAELWGVRASEAVDSAERYYALHNQALVQNQRLCQWSKTLEVLQSMESIRDYSPEIYAMNMECLPPLGLWKNQADQLELLSEKLSKGPLRGKAFEELAIFYETRLQAPEDALKFYTAALEEGQVSVEDDIVRLNNVIEKKSTQEESTSEEQDIETEELEHK